MARYYINRYRSNAGGAKIKMKTFIVIAAFNEERTVENVIKGLKREGYSDIILVDDASSDKTAILANNASATVLRHIINRGQGAALQTGIDYALEHNADIIVTFDADGQHNEKDVRNVIAPIIKKEADVVFGSRFLGGSKVPFFKKWTLKGGIFFTWIFSGIWLSDVHCGFRAFSRDAAKKIKITYDRMEHASEIIDEVVRKKIKYIEVPVHVKYTKYAVQKGQSIFNSIKMASKLLFGRFLK